MSTRAATHSRRAVLGAATWAALALSPLSLRAEDDFARVCREKMQAIYRAAMRFAADHDGYLPPAWMDPKLRQPIRGRGHWLAYLKPYLTGMGERTDCGYRRNRRQPAGGVAHCPANPYWYGGNGPNCIGYAWNSELGLVGAGGAAVARGPYRFADIANKERTILLVDAAGRPGNLPRCHYHAGRPAEAGAWHDGKVHVLFLDGHIEALPPEKISPDWFAVRVRPAAKSSKP